MIQLLPVAQLVNHHIVQHLRWTQHQQAVEIQIPLGAAAAPAGVLTADRDTAIGHTGPGGKICQP